MNTSQFTGLGEPDVTGKQSLFQPPPPELAATSRNDLLNQTPKKQKPRASRKSKSNARRVHVTTDMTLEALQTIQAIQQKYRVRTGKVLPMWKAVSQAVEYYAQAKEDVIFKT